MFRWLFLAFVRNGVAHASIMHFYSNTCCLGWSQYCNKQSINRTSIPTWQTKATLHFCHDGKPTCPCFQYDLIIQYLLRMLSYMRPLSLLLTGEWRCENGIVIMVSNCLLSMVGYRVSFLVIGCVMKYKVCLCLPFTHVVCFA